MHSLGLSFESAEELYWKICTDLPQAPRFNQITVRMKEAPNEPQTVVHRNILKCVDYLFERPRTSGVDFEPVEILGSKGEGRIYHQMSHGHLWNEFQVCGHTWIGDSANWGIQDLH